MQSTIRPLSFPLFPMFRVRRSSFLSIIVLCVMVGNVSAAGLTDFVNTRARAVSRGDFLEWTLRAMNIPFEKTCTVPYDALTERMKKVFCALDERDALRDAFPATTDFSKPITRGEALVFLTVFTKAHDTANVSKYRDSRTKDPLLLRALQNAVARKWLSPLTPTFFGLSRNLTGPDALSLLQGLTNQNPVKQKIQIKVNVAPPVQSASMPDADLVNAVWQLLNRDYLRSDSINQKEVTYKMIEGMVNSLGDPYTTFFRPVQADQFETQIKGEVTGIGAHVEMASGSLVIVAPLPNSPAERAGLLPGDIIEKADGITLTGLPLDQAVSHIRGDKGTSVLLTIRRGSSVLSITVVRDTVSVPEIDVSWKGSVAIVTLAQFGDTTDQKIRSVMQQVADQSPSGIVIDLRNNPGGLLHAADVFMSTLVPRGSTVAQVKGKTSSSNEVTDLDPVINPTTPVAVLVNSGSASAAEIVAGALQDYKRATIVGTKTFGKGTVQEVLSFTGGEALKITIAEWLTPLGRKIDKIGVMPDIVTTDTATPDQQMKAALNALR